MRNFLWMACILVACGGPRERPFGLDTPTTPKPPPAPGETAVVMGGVGLSVDSAGYQLSESGLRPREGRRLLVVDLTVENVSHPDPIPVAFLLFQLRLAGSTLLQASPLSSRLDDACAEDLLIDTGGVISCDVAFEVPLEGTPEAVVFSFGTKMIEAAVAATINDAELALCAEILPLCALSISQGSPCSYCAQDLCWEELNVLYDQFYCMSPCGIGPTVEGGTCTEMSCVPPLDGACCWSDFAMASRGLTTCMNSRCTQSCR